MVEFHIVHRRLAVLFEKSERLGGFDKLSKAEQMDIMHCLKVNATLVRRLDELKNLSFVAHQIGDMEWQQEICRKIEEIEADFYYF